MKHVVVGRGAVGVALYGHLSSLYPASQLLFCDRKQFKKFSEETLYRSKSKPGAVWLCLKAFDLRYTLQQLQHLLNIPLISLSNGYTDEIFYEIKLGLKNNVSSFYLRRGLAFFGSYLIGDKLCISTIRKPNSLLWGEISGFGQSGKVFPIEKELIKLSQTFQFLSPSMISQRYLEKWYVNTVLNCLCTSRKLAWNGLALNFPEDLKALEREAFRLGRELFPQVKLNSLHLKTVLRKMIEKTFYNQNSMLTDQLKGKKTEAPFLSGMAKNKRSFPCLDKLNSIF